MTNKDILDEFDKILADIEKKADEPLEMPEKKEKEEPVINNKVFYDLEAPSVEEKEEEPDFKIDFPELDESLKESSELKSPVASVDEFVKPVLEEKKEDPLVINLDEQREAYVTPPFKVPDLVGTISSEEPSIPSKEMPIIHEYEKPEEKETKMPDPDKIKEKSVGEVVIPKNSKKVNKSKELYEKKKKVISKIIAVVLAAYIGLAVMPNQAIEESYQNKIGVGLGDFIAYDVDDLVPPTEVEDIGRQIADQIKLEMDEYNGLHAADKNDRYDVNKMVMVYLGTAYKHIVHTLAYTKKGTINESYGAGERNDEWLVKLYKLMQSHLRADGTIDLPENLMDYMKANGLFNGKMKYDELTNKLKIDDTVGEVDYYQALDNLEEFSRYLIGHEINPAKKVQEEFIDKLSKVQELYPKNLVSFDSEGIKVYDDKMQPLYLVTSTDPIVLIDVSQNNINSIDREGANNARS